jgi:hypothetical protein
MYDFVASHQTLIVGVVGFAGVIVTLITNASLARKQHARQIEHENATVRVALKAELEAVAESFRDRIEIFSALNQEREGGLLSLETMTEIYKSTLSRLGLLSTTQVRAVIRAYALVEQLPDRLSYLATSGSESRIYIPMKNFAHAADMHRNYLQVINAAISELS